MLVLSPTLESSEYGSLGLSGIEERVRLMGGRCKWLSNPGQGTTLAILIPLAERLKVDS